MFLTLLRKEWVDHLLRLRFALAVLICVVILPIGLGTVYAPLGCPGLDTVQYALDFALPVINLGQDTCCRFVPVGPARWLWLTLHSLFAIFGAGLSAVVVLTLTGVLRRD